MKSGSFSAKRRLKPLKNLDVAAFTERRWNFLIVTLVTAPGVIVLPSTETEKPPTASDPVMT